MNSEKIDIMNRINPYSFFKRMSFSIRFCYTVIVAMLFCGFFFTPSGAFAQNNGLSGFVSAYQDASNVSIFIGQPFYIQYESDSVEISEGLAQAQLIRTVINADTCQDYGFDRYGFSFPATTPPGTYSDSVYSWNSQYNYDTATVLNLTIFPVYSEHDTSLLYADLLGAYTPGPDTIVLPTVHGCDSTIYRMIYSLTCNEDFSDTADYGAEEMAVSLVDPIVIPNDGNVVVNSNQRPAYPTGYTTQVNWSVSVAGDTLGCVQDVSIHFPRCGGAFTATDADGNVYNTVRLGYNCWTQQNMKTTHYDNSDVVDVAMIYNTNEYPNIEQNLSLFGRLYSWRSAVGLPEQSNATPPINADGFVQGICPIGWHVPSANNFSELTMYDAQELKSDNFWIRPGTNLSNFTALPAGYYNSTTHRFEALLGNTYYWTITPSNTLYFACNISYFCDELTVTPEIKDYAFSVRCIKD